MARQHSASHGHPVVGVEHGWRIGQKNRYGVATADLADSTNAMDSH